MNPEIYSSQKAKDPQQKQRGLGPNEHNTISDMINTIICIEQGHDIQNSYNCGNKSMRELTTAK